MRQVHQEASFNNLANSSFKSLNMRTRAQWHASAIEEAAILLWQRHSLTAAGLCVSALPTCRPNTHDVKHA